MAAQTVMISNGEIIAFCLILGVFALFVLALFLLPQRPRFNTDEEDYRQWQRNEWASTIATQEREERHYEEWQKAEWRRYRRTQIFAAIRSFFSRQSPSSQEPKSQNPQRE